MQDKPPLAPIVMAIVGIGLFAAMDAVMKGAALAVGAFSAFFLRCLIGFCIIAPVWWLTGRRWPEKFVMRIHLVRGFITAFMGWSFFYSLIYLPLAEAIALSFIAPLIALYLAALLLKEDVHPRAYFAALLGLAGVIVIVAGKLGRADLHDDIWKGLAALLISALLYAWNLVLQRQQALVARPAEVSMFQNGMVVLVLLAGTPFLLQWPDQATWNYLGAGALFAIGATLCLTWAYARAEAQRLVPIEYTAFLWAVLFGWFLYDETATVATIAGTALIVLGCWIATRHKERADQHQPIDPIP